MVDALAKDARALLGALDGRELTDAVGQAAALLAAVAGQDLDEGADGVFRIARRVAKDRVISTVDPKARHGHKTAARGFDGYKGHVAIDPDSELITATTVTAGNVGDARAADELLADDLPGGASVAADGPAADKPARPTSRRPAGSPTTQPDRRPSPSRTTAVTASVWRSTATAPTARAPCWTPSSRPTRTSCARCSRPSRPADATQDAFQIDLHAGTVTCPASHVAPLRTIKNGQIAHFAKACTGCPLAAKCTTSADGRSIRLTAHEAALTRARARQTDPAWQADYKATRPKVERKIGHLMRRKHGARRARMRGQTKIDADFNLLASAVNLARLATLGLSLTPAGWTATSA